MDKLIGYESEILNGNMLSVQVNLLNKCPSRCLSCRKYEWPDVQIPYDKLEMLLTSLKGQGLQTVVFSGGDPLMYHMLPDAIHFCVENGIKFSLITTLICKDDALLELIAKTAYRIHVSIDSVSDEMYKYIRGVDGLSIVKDSIKKINAVRPKDMIPIRISSTMSNLNFKETYALYDFAKVNNCLVNFYNLHTWENLKMSNVDRDLFQCGLKQIVDDEIKNNKQISNARSLYCDNWFGSSGATYKDENMPCYLPIVNATIDSNGDIYPCCKLLNDNGEYGEQTKYAYGNIRNCTTVSDIDFEFAKRFDLHYGIDCDVCKECAQRYCGVIEDLFVINNKNKREPMFL